MIEHDVSEHVVVPSCLSVLTISDFVVVAGLSDTRKKALVPTYDKLSQQRALTEEGLEFKAANQCSDFLNQFRKSPDVYGVYCKCPL